MKIGDKQLKVLYVSSEIAPFAKTGGLADVSRDLPKELRQKGIDIRTVMPKYKSIKEDLKDSFIYLTSMDIELDWRKHVANIYQYNTEVINYFIENPAYFNRDDFYGYTDDGERYAFFCKSVMEMLPKLDFKPDIIHCNDWQTGSICMILKDHYVENDFYKNMKCVYTIHNLQYQGVFTDETLIMLDIDPVDENKAAVEYYGQVNYMKAGLNYSDAITTVSKTYANEIKYPYFGYGLDGVLRQKEDILYGILNGIDYEKFNPSTDPYIYKNYNENSIDIKYENKRMLQEELGLPVKDVPIVGIITRLAEQKGIDLIIYVIDEILTKEDMQFVLIGTGEYHYEEFFKGLQERYPDKTSINIKFSVPLAQKVYAGCDMFLMPSKFEPCGLGQLYSLCFGTIPIVRRTGGLSDTVSYFIEETGKGNGFLFDSYNGHDMKAAIEKALNLYNNDKDSWRALVKNAMTSDFSWDKSAQQYIDLYQKILKDDKKERIEKQEEKNYKTLENYK